MNGPSTPAPSVASGRYSAAMQLVDAIAALPDLTKSALEVQLGLSMAHKDGAAPDELYYVAVLPSGPFGRIEVRQSNATQDQFALVILDVRATEKIPIAPFHETRRIGSDTRLDVNPHVPPDGTLTYSVSVNKQVTSYTFDAKGERLSSVVIDRRPTNAP
jgi:hypothetical protein